MCHWLGMLRPALVAHTDALGAGNAVRQNGQRYVVTRVRGGRRTGATTIEDRTRACGSTRGTTRLREV